MRNIGIELGKRGRKMNILSDFFKGFRKGKEERAKNMERTVKKKEVITLINKAILEDKDPLFYVRIKQIKEIEK